MLDFASLLQMLQRGYGNQGQQPGLGELSMGGGGMSPQVAAAQQQIAQFRANKQASLAATPSGPAATGIGKDGFPYRRAQIRADGGPSWFGATHHNITQQYTLDPKTGKVVLTDGGGPTTDLSINAGGSN